MRVVFVTETWKPSVDGVVTRLAPTVDDLARRGHEVLVVAPTRAQPLTGVTQVLSAGAGVPLLDARRRWGRPDRRVLRAIRAFEPDVVHVVNPVLLGTWAVRRFVGRVPVGASLHTDLMAYLSRYHLSAARPVLRALNRAAYRQADLALATSTTGVRVLTDLGVRQPGIWPPGVHAIFTSSARPSRSLELSSRPPLGREIEVLCVGRLAREKQYELLAPTMSSGAAASALRLTLVGDGPDRGRLERFFAGTSTTFAGPLHGPALVAAYRNADVVAFTSRTETVGLVLLEAAALGRPLVAVDSPAARETLDGYSRAWFVPADADAITWCNALDNAARSSEPSGDEAAAWRPASWRQATDALLASYAAITPRASVKRSRRST